MKEEAICRFCLSETPPCRVEQRMNKGRWWIRIFRNNKAQGGGGQTKEVMLSPCACSGTIEYVHLSCLGRWIQTKLNKGYSMKRACECPVCLQQYKVPDGFFQVSNKIPLRVLSCAVQCYFSTYFMVGAFRGASATTSTALWLFPGLPLNAVTQAMDARPGAIRKLACLGVPLLPMYTKMAFQASAFMVLKGCLFGGVCGSAVGGRHLFRWLSRLLRRE